MLRRLTLILLSMFAAIPAIAHVETAPSFTTVDYEIAFTRVDVAGEISLPTIELFEPETRLTLFPSNRKLASGSSTSLAGTNYLEQQELSAESWQGHDYMHARYYSPVMGRFLSVDPAMDLKRNLSRPQRWNRYSYVTNNPVNRFDPDGKDEVMAAGSEMMWLLASSAAQFVVATTPPEYRMMASMALRGELPGMELMGGAGSKGGIFKTLSRGGAAPVRMGQAGETLAGITGKKIRITVDGRIRIPDQLTSVSLTEVKNVFKLSKTSQLRDFLKFSQETGRGFTLVVREDTKLSKPLQQLVNEGLIKLERTLPTQ